MQCATLSWALTTPHGCWGSNVQEASAASAASLRLEVKTQEADPPEDLPDFYELHRLADWLDVDAVWLRQQLSEAHLFSVRTK